MLFSSLLFLFVFLPGVLLVYYSIPARFLKARNLALLLFSLIFYAWGEPKYILLMLFSIGMNYLFGRLLGAGNTRHRGTLLAVAVVLNLSLLGVYKYLGLFGELVTALTGEGLSLPELALPIGISFYTFQAMSYVIDVYRRVIPAERSLITFGAYISFFPQLIAGPIVQYKLVEQELHARRHDGELFSDGALRFVAGLGKKVLLANGIGQLFDVVSGLSEGQMTTDVAWLAVIAYTFQIYFDFSGYSDMAIGLGCMFGFHFPENFAYPYESKSITEFWRRWHMTLGGWFREYVYIPLGGNRRGLRRQVLAILIVWALTGLWHGASYNFILWGLYYGLLLLVEKLLIGAYLERLPNFLRHCYALLWIVIGWAIFCYPDMENGASYCRALLFGSMQVSSRGLFLLREYGGLLLLCVLGATSLPKRVAAKVLCLRRAEEEALPPHRAEEEALPPHRAEEEAAERALSPYRIGRNILEILYVLVLLALCTASLVNSSYNPFLYFRF